MPGATRKRVLKARIRLRLQRKRLLGLPEDQRTMGGENGRQHHDRCTFYDRVGSLPVEGPSRLTIPAKTGSSQSCLHQSSREQSRCSSPRPCRNYPESCDRSACRRSVDQRQWIGNSHQRPEAAGGNIEFVNTVALVIDTWAKSGSAAGTSMRDEADHAAAALSDGVRMRLYDQALNLAGIGAWECELE